MAHYFLEESTIAPVALLVAQSTINCYPKDSDRPMPTEIKAMKLWESLYSTRIAVASEDKLLTP